MTSVPDQKFAQSDSDRTVICLATFGARLATLFDTAERFELFEIANGGVIPVGRLFHSQTDPAEIPGLLAAHGVSHVICGGMGPELARALTGLGIEVTPFICGMPDEIASAFCAGTLAEHRMPGCCGRRQGRGTGIVPGMGRTAGAGMGRGKGRGCRRNTTLNNGEDQ